MPKRIPQRTCIGCRTTTDKFRLIRIVRTPEGRIEIDPRGKKSGRGAYLCPAFECWQKGLKGNRLPYALRGEVKAEDLMRLKEFAQSLPQGQ